MPDCRLSWKRLSVVAAGVMLATAMEGAGISVGEPLRVRILYDNSGSMHPGYKPPGSPGRKTMHEMGVHSFHEYPAFQQWLGNFVARQTILDGGSVGMWTFTTQGPFAAEGIHQVHPEVTIDQFDVASAVEHFPPRVGQTTYLKETLVYFTRDFTGLVWLITDNIVETRAGEPDSDVVEFFNSLKGEDKYRSVHLFKYPFKDEQAGQSSYLAVYGILVSAADVPEPVLSYYDRKFRTTFRAADCREGDPPRPLFPGREHLKLKNLHVDALELHAVPTLTVVLDHPENGALREGETIKLRLEGEIKSFLTQHSVTGGRYQLAMSSPFQPEEWASRNLGTQPLTSAMFPSVGGEITEPIRPGKTRDVTALLQSSGPVPLTSKGLGGWLHLAFSGAAVKYNGTVTMTFQDVHVALERAPMAGIFGIDKASRVFDFQDVTDLGQVNPSNAQVSFTLVTGSRRTLVLLIFLVLVAVLLGIVWAVVGRKQWYRIRIAGTPERLIPLRRLGSHAVVHEGQTLGRLSRGISGDYDFAPNQNSAAFTIAAARQPDTWDIRFRDARGCQLSIEPQGGGKRKPPKETGVSSGPPDAPPGSPPHGTAGPPRTLPKIDRP